MRNVCVIGCGNLGKRHVEGLSKSLNIRQIYLIDPVVQNLINAERLNKNKNILITKLHNIDGLPPKLDLVIVATNANVRKAVLESLLERVVVNKIILEKIVFNNRDHFNEIEQLFNDNNVTCEVNFTRRKWLFYQWLKKILNKPAYIHVDVTGSCWGLASSGLHFIDLLSYLSGQASTSPLKFTSNLSKTNSKRESHFELLGSINFKGLNSELNLISHSGSVEAHIITINTDKYRIKINEPAGRADFHANEVILDSINFNVPYQSDLSGVLADEFFVSNTSGLTSFVEAMEAHYLFFDAIDSVSGLKNNANDFLIT